MWAGPAPPWFASASTTGQRQRAQLALSPLQHNRRGTCPAPRTEDSAAHRIQRQSGMAEAGWER